MTHGSTAWLNEDGSTTLYAQQLAAVEELRGYDHCFIPQDVVERITTPFGFKGYTYVARSDAGPDNPKGLTLADGLTELRGQDAAEVAAEICKKLKVSYPPMFGRGSRLRACCEALKLHITNKDLNETVAGLFN